MRSTVRFTRFAARQNKKIPPFCAFVPVLYPNWRIVCLINLLSIASLLLQATWSRCCQPWWLSAWWRWWQLRSLKSSFRLRWRRPLNRSHSTVAASPASHRMTSSMTAATTSASSRRSASTTLERDGKERRRAAERAVICEWSRNTAPCPRTVITPTSTG